MYKIFLRSVLLDMFSNPKIASERLKRFIVSIYILSFLLISLVFNHPDEIIQGLKDIILAPSTLVSDYFAVGNIGAAIVNSSLLMIISVVLAIFNNLNLNV